MIHAGPWQWFLGAAAALLVGLSKTGIPGLGILTVTLLAAAFGGRQSIGIMLPMLILGDVFAVLWYRRHAHWEAILGLLPWVLAGIALGAAALALLGRVSDGRDLLSPIIGWLVLTMLALHLLRHRLGERFAPQSPIGVAATGAAAGFATTVSNAAGPVMSIYLVAHRLTKEQFIGTLAWYFFALNLCKVPIYAVLTALNPAQPILTGASLALNAALSPAVVAGVVAGKWLLPRIPQQLFETLVLFLAGVAALRLVFG
jgi:uncharacterized protein